MEILSTIVTVILFLGYVFLWKIKRSQLLKNNAVDPNILRANESPIQVYFGFLERVMRVTIILIILFYLFFKNKFGVTFTIEVLDNFETKIIAFGIGLLGLIICKIAQNTLGDSWRVGIDENARPGLVTKGIYSYVRNPTYSGLYILCIAVWLINPCVLYFCWMMLFYIMLEFQVRSEEEYLQTKYGKDYIEYSKNTKRYIPFIY